MANLMKVWHIIVWLMCCMLITMPIVTEADQNGNDFRYISHQGNLI